jgi:uncharacterized protein
MPKKYVKKIPASSLSARPWKNGGGTTREIAIHPLESSLEKNDFTWRLSSAEVKQDGDFSLFPDFERLLTIASGSEMVLEFAGERKLLQPGTVVRFRGDEKIFCSLPKGPVSDLGLIFDPDQALAKMSVVKLHGRPRSFALTAPTVFFFCAGGEVDSSAFPGEIGNSLKEGDTLRIGALEEERVILLDPGPGEATLVAVELALVEVRSN